MNGASQQKLTGDMQPADKFVCSKTVTFMPKNELCQILMLNFYKL